MKPFGEKDIDLMLKYKKEECEKNGEPFDGKINMYDRMLVNSLFFCISYIRNYIS